MSGETKISTSGNRELNENLIEPDLQFHYLPGFAAFLLDHKLEEFARKHLEFSKEENLPLLRLPAGIDEKTFDAITLKSAKELLDSLVNNTSRQHILQLGRKYVANQIPFFEHGTLVAEDITLLSLVRRKTLRIFLQHYTSDMSLFIKVMEEVDRYIAYSEALYFKAFFELQGEKIIEINKQLEYQHELLLAAQDMAQMGSFSWDLENGVAEFTPGVEKIIELKNVGNLGDFLDLIDEDDRVKVYDSIYNSIYNNGIYECEYWLGNRFTKKRIWSKGVVTFRDEKPVWMKGTLMDITTKHSLVKKLQQSEEQNKQAQALTHIGNWSWDIQDNEITWSDEMYRIYGLEPQSEKITFERFLSLIHADDRQQRIDEINEALKSGIARDYILRIVNPDGKIKVLQGKGEVIIKNNRPLKLVGTCQDITREHLLRSELLENEKYLNQLINNAPDSVIVINSYSEIMLWNPKTEEIFGWKSEEVLGKQLSDVIIPIQYREAHNIGMKRLQETGEARILNKSLELSALRKDGREFFVSLTISRSFQHGKQLFIAFLRDITAEKQIKADIQIKTGQLIRLNASLESKNKELEQINKELESFNYIASHDLQEPLRKIHTFAGRILDLEQEAMSRSSLLYFSKIMNAANRMQTLIDDLLTFSQTTSPKSNFQKSDLNAIVNDVKNILSASIEEKNAVIKVDPLPIIMGLPFQLQQLMLNLISNALKYSKDDTVPEINITSGIVKSNAIEEQDASESREYFQLKVADNGIGFEMHNAEKIFDLFQRLHHRNQYSGTGIGLAICKKIAHNHNGFIKASSIPSKGSVFTLNIPLERDGNELLLN